MKKVLVMGILSLLFGLTNSTAQENGFVSEATYKSNLARQISMSPQTMEKLRQYGVTSESELKLEYFFYTNSITKAKSLANALKKLNYTVELGPSASDSSLIIITGWTSPLIMDTKIVTDWSGEMTTLGYEYDSEFDGWGTNPEQ